MAKWLVVLLFATTGCLEMDPAATFELGADGIGLAGSLADDGGGDVLPKQGAHAVDPTIFTARAFCSGPKVLYVEVDGRDPKGTTNLAACAAAIGADTEQAKFAHSTCYLPFESFGCTVGESYVVDIAISSESRGETTASVTLTAE